MAHVQYRVVQHDGGWAYTLDGAFSEPFRTHDEALVAARRVVAEQRLPDETHEIEYQDAQGVWHKEIAQGDDRPDGDVVQ